MNRSITLVIVVGALCACNGPSHENSNMRSVMLTEPVRLESSHVINYPGIVREAHTISLGFKNSRTDRTYPGARGRLRPKRHPAGRTGRCRLPVRGRGITDTIRPTRRGSSTDRETFQPEKRFCQRLRKKPLQA